jgi:hypothetical protein
MPWFLKRQSAEHAMITVLGLARQEDTGFAASRETCNKVIDPIILVACDDVPRDLSRGVKLM